MNPRKIFPSMAARGKYHFNYSLFFVSQRNSDELFGNLYMFHKIPTEIKFEVFSKTFVFL